MVAVGEAIVREGRWQGRQLAEEADKSTPLPLPEASLSGIPLLLLPHKIGDQLGRGPVAACGELGIDVAANGFG
jgi:hypothetical protein